MVLTLLFVGEGAAEAAGELGDEAGEEAEPVVAGVAAVADADAAADGADAAVVESEDDAEILKAVTPDVRTGAE